MRFDSLSDSEVDDNLGVVLADCPIDADVRYDVVAIEKRDENRFDFRPERKIEDLKNVKFVLQPIFEDGGTAERIRYDVC